MSVRAILVLLLAATSVIAADPDFSGSWVLNEEESSFRFFRGEIPKTLLIRQEGDTIQRATPVPGTNRTAKWRHVINGRETKHQVGDEERRCMLKWEGDALLTNSLVSGSRGQYTLMDRWRLSADRKTLRIRRQMITRRGESEANLLYERDE